MRYIFDVNEKNNKFEIKFTIQEANSPMNSQWHIISADASENPEWNMECPQVLKLLLDNLRFSVSERIDAEHNLSILLSYLYGNLMKAIDNTPQSQEQMIVEGDDSKDGVSDDKNTK